MQNNCSSALYSLMHFYERLAGWQAYRLCVWVIMGWVVVVVGGWRCEGTTASSGIRTGRDRRQCSLYCIAEHRQSGRFILREISVRKSLGSKYLYETAKPLSYIEYFQVSTDYRACKSPDIFDLSVKRKKMALDPISATASLVALWL